MKCGMSSKNVRTVSQDLIRKMEKPRSLLLFHRFYSQGVCSRAHDFKRQSRLRYVHLTPSARDPSLQSFIHAPAHSSIQSSTHLCILSSTHYCDYQSTYCGCRFLGFARRTCVHSQDPHTAQARTSVLSVPLTR